MRVDAFQQQAQVLVFVLCEMVGTHGGFSRYGNNWFVVGLDRQDCNDADERELHRALFCCAKKYYSEHYNTTMLMWWELRIYVILAKRKNGPVGVIFLLFSDSLFVL